MSDSTQLLISNIKTDAEETQYLSRKLLSSPLVRKRRWLVLFSFFILSVANGFAWGTYSAIVSTAADYYSVDSSTVLWFTWEYYFAYVLFSFPGAALLGMNLSRTLIAGSLINAIGGWLRYVAFQKFYLAMIGQVLISTATNVILPASNVLANMWFGERERFLSVTTGVVANSLGVGVGILFSPLIVGEGNAELIERLNFIEAIILSAPLILCLLFVRNNGKLQQTILSDLGGGVTEQFSFWQSIKILFKNKNYMIAVLGFGINNGNCWNMLGIIDVFLKNDDISSLMVGVIGLTFILSAIIGSFAGTFFLKFSPSCQRYFSLIIKSLITLSALSFIGVSIIVSLKANIAILMVVTVFLGIGALGLQPFACQKLEELGKPVNASVSVNGMFFFTCFFGFPISFIATLPVFGDYGLWTLAVSVVPFTIYSLFFQSERPGQKLSGKDLYY